MRENELTAIKTFCRALEPYPYPEPPEQEIVEEIEIKPLKSKYYEPTRNR
jgi:hypothetical protein